MRNLALKIDVDTYRGTREGVPRLIEILQRHGARATFLSSLGPDHTGRAIKRALRPGFMSKVSRTSVVSHYGVRTLLYGTVLPGPNIGLKCADILRGVRDAGHEVGIHTWDHVKWQDGVLDADNPWVEAELERASSRFAEVFGVKAHVHGAAGWQMNRHAFRMTQRLGFAYCSDTRGTHPFMPVVDGELIDCPQLPTTLPTIDELIGIDGLTAQNVAAHVLDITAQAPRHPHVYTLHAELEGMQLGNVFDALLSGWQEQGYTLHPMQDIMNALNREALPRHRLDRGSVPGRAGTLMTQGASFP